jgi:hypothetical protein
VTGEKDIYDPVNPGDFEIVCMHEKWQNAVDASQWGQADQYCRMYLQLLKRRDMLGQAPAHIADVTESLPVELTGSYSCTRSGCPGPADQCSCGRQCGAPGCHGWHAEGFE